jgi:hypothetical protein
MWRGDETDEAKLRCSRPDRCCGLALSRPFRYCANARYPALVEIRVSFASPEQERDGCRVTLAAWLLDRLGQLIVMVLKI